jgi:hypothetical protein
MRDCPEPEMILGVANAWELRAVGNATWDFAGASAFTPFPGHTDMWLLGGLLFTDFLSGTGMITGKILTGGASMSPAGMPIMDSEMFWFSINMTMGDLPHGSTGDGILIDSTAYAGAA